MKMKEALEKLKEHPVFSERAQELAATPSFREKMKKKAISLKNRKK